MQLFELDYEDAGETVVTGVPASALHDLRMVVVSTDPVLERRLRQHLESRGAHVEVIPDWGRASLYRVQGLDPHLILLDPETNLRQRADASRRLGDDTRLRWAMLDRVPRGIDSSDGIDRLIEIATVALGPDRRLQAEALLAEGNTFRTPVDTVGPARLLWLLSAGGGAHRITFEDGAVRGMIDIADGFVVHARWVEAGREREALVGLPAVTALSALRMGEMRIEHLDNEADTHIDDVGLASDVLGRSARPELSWVATRVATGRYLYPPPGASSMLETDLPEATKRETPSALAHEKPTIEVPVVEHARGLASETVPETLAMARMPHTSGPKAPLDTITHKPDPTAVLIQTIVRLDTPVERRDGAEHAMGSIDIDVELELELEEPTRPSYDLLPSTSSPLAPTAPTALLASTPPGPVSAIDTVRPGVRRARRSVWPWLLAAAILLGLGGASAGVYVVGTDRIASFASETLEQLPLEELPWDVGTTSPVTAPAANPNDAVAPATSPTVPSAIVDTTPAADDTMVFDLADSSDRGSGDDANARPDGQQRRRRARRLLAEARDSAPADAVAAYLRILDRDPNNATAMIGLAEAQLGLGHTDEAVQWADRATSNRPESAAAWEIFGRALRASGDAVTGDQAMARARALAASAEGESTASSEDESTSDEPSIHEPTSDAPPSGAAPVARATDELNPAPASPPAPLPALRDPSSILPPAF